MPVHFRRLQCRRIKTDLTNSVCFQNIDFRNRFHVMFMISDSSLKLICMCYLFVAAERLAMQNTQKKAPPKAAKLQPTHSGRSRFFGSGLPAWGIAEHKTLQATAIRECEYKRKRKTERQTASVSLSVLSVCMS